jgi:hypothetical protein
MARMIDLWRPLVKRGPNEWLGATSTPGIWTGTEEHARALVDLDNPVYLWPLLERSLAEVESELNRNWVEFRVTDRQVERTIEAIVRSALRSGRPYWIGQAVTWLESMIDSPQYQAAGFCLDIEELQGLPQELQHRVIRLRNRLRAT